ncbi:unnamed protein product, partial [Didymodactylos carnosus]
ITDQRRGRYVRVSDIDRRQLIDAYKSGEDFIALAKKLNIKRSTARSILRTYIDEGRISAKQRAGTRLRFITEEEAEMIREMKRRHPLITIGQIQMKLQRTSNRVLSKASISRILTNSIRLGKRAKRSMDGQEDDEGEKLDNDDSEMMVLEEEDGLIEINENEENENDELQNLEDFQRFMWRKASNNGEDGTTVTGENGWDAKEHFKDDDNVSHSYQGYDTVWTGYESEEDGEEDDEDNVTENISVTNEQHSGTSPPLMNGATVSENGCWNLSIVKSEPVCVFLNRNYENSSDSEDLNTSQQSSMIVNGLPDNHEQNATMEKNIIQKSIQSNSTRGTKDCPICGLKNFSRLSHHLTVAHNLNRQESHSILSYTDLHNDDHSPGSNTTINHHHQSATTSDKSPQQTPINLNANNQLKSPIESISSSPVTTATASTTTTIPISTTTITSSPSSAVEQQSYVPLDGKKRLLCPRCDTWVLNLTDHLIKKHHLVSKQERLPFLRLARNRYIPGSSTASLLTTEKQNANDMNDSIKITNVTQHPFVISPDYSVNDPDSNGKDKQETAISANEQQQQQQQQRNNDKDYQKNVNFQQAAKRYHKIVKKYRKKFMNVTAQSSTIQDKNEHLVQNGTNNHQDVQSRHSDANNSDMNMRTNVENNNNLLTVHSLLGQQTGFGLKSTEKYNPKFINNNEQIQRTLSMKTNKDQAATNQKFEQRLIVFRQQFAVTIAMQQSLMQQMELLQRSFVCIEDEWNDMKQKISV